MDEQRNRCLQSENVHSIRDIYRSASNVLLLLACYYYGTLFASFSCIKDTNFHHVFYTQVFCTGDNCAAFEGTSIILARSLLILLLFTILFTTSMILNQIYGMATGLGTIDRMKLKKGDYYVEEPVAFEQIFGSDYWLWIFPTNPRISKREETLGYCIPSNRDSSV